MKSLIHITCILLFSIAFISCKKENVTAPVNEQAGTALKITVKDISGRGVHDAQVQLFQSFENWQNKTGILKTKNTDSDGIVLFNNLDANKYYYYASIGCINNGASNVSTAGAITADIINDASTTIQETGNLILKNSSSNPYRIFINGVPTLDQAGNSTRVINYQPSGSYAVRVLQLSGYVVSPTDQTYTGNITCGGTLTVNFPQ